MNLLNIKTIKLIKQKWCQDNNVTLIIIPYLEETKIDQILSNHFNT